MVVAEVDPEVEEALVVGVVVIRLEVVIVVDTGADVAGDSLRTKPSEKLSAAIGSAFWKVYDSGLMGGSPRLR